ncbi:MAG TPA: hypothetical protein VNH11_09165 [Pirellulales bacterium]|nr:hypothetical protein [Pirellulales bacterium]HVA46531.1 hypothetical protein [Pirellulales bacterium]
MQRPLETTTQELVPTETKIPPTASPAADLTDKKWQIDRGAGVPSPVIRTNMISLRRSYQGRVKVAFFERD